MPLYNDDDPEEYVGLQHEIAKELLAPMSPAGVGQPVTKDDVWQLVQATDLPTPDDAEIETLLRGMGYEERYDDDDNEVWAPRWIPIIGTGDRDSIAHGGGIVLWDTEDEMFRYHLWRSPDDEEDPDAEWTVRWIDFGNGEPLAGLLAVARLDAEELLQLGNSVDFFDQVRLLEYLGDVDPDTVDYAPAVFDRQQMIETYGYLTDVVAGRSHDNVELVLGELGLNFGSSAPSGPTPVDLALDAINARRRQLMMAPLDPVAAGWSEEDVLLEAKRLQANPAASPRAALLDWTPI